MFDGEQVLDDPSVAQPVWFTGDDLPVGVAREFAEAVRSAARAWEPADLGITPAETSTYLLLNRQVIEAEIPGLTCTRRLVRVAYTPNDSGEALLDAEWAGEYFFDGPPDDEVGKLRGSPSECGVWAAAWIEEQLRQPVTRREWDRPAGVLARLLPGESDTVAAVEWRYADTNDLMEDRGTLTWWWLVRQPPSREVVERPDRLGG